MAHFSKCVKILRATKNHVAGHIWPAGREFDIPGLNGKTIDNDLHFQIKRLYGMKVFYCKYL